jgi:hypothetical protein
MAEPAAQRSKGLLEKTPNCEYLLFLISLVATFISVGIVVSHLVAEYHDSATSKISPPPSHSGPKPHYRAVKRSSYVIHCEHYSGPKLVPCARGRLRGM